MEIITLARVGFKNCFIYSILSKNRLKGDFERVVYGTMLEPVLSLFNNNIFYKKIDSVG